MDLDSEIEVMIWKTAGKGPELEQLRIFTNHRIAWTTGGSINKMLRVNRKEKDTQKVTG